MPRTVSHAGCDLSYEVCGSGPPVVFIHGVGVHGSGWRTQVEGLSGRFACLSFDNRGIGESQPPSQQLTVEQMAGDTLALMDACCWRQAHIVGHSLGGLIALFVALQAPRRTRSLSLLCTFADGAEATRLSAWMLWVGLRSRIGTRRQRRHAFLQLVMPPEELAKADKDKLAAELAAIFGHDLADQPAITLSQMSAMRACNVTSRLGELSGIPSLVVSARHDRIARPELGRAIARGIPGASFIEIADASHGATIQCAGRVNRLLSDHFEKAG